MVVRVDHIAHGRLLGLVGHDDRLVGTFAEPVVQVDAVLFELAGEDAFDLFAQPGDVAGSGDVDLRAERSRAYGHGSRDVFGMFDEQSVGVDAVAEFGGVRPRCVHFGQRLVTFAQDQDVGDHFGARLPVECLPGQAACGDKFGLAGEAAAHVRRVLVERVPAGEHGDETAGAHRVETVLDEPVVDDGAVYPDRVAVRHVADREVERVRGQSGPFHPVVDDVVVRTQVACDAGADRVGFDAGEPVGRSGRRGADEVAGSATGFQHHVRVFRILAETGLAKGLPHRVHDGSWRVEGRERAAARVRVFGVGEQFAKTRVDLAPRRIVTVFFERLLGAAPARVRGEGADVIVGGFAATVVEVAQHLDGAYVRACAFEAGSRGLQIRVEQAAVDVGQRASTTFLMAISSA